MSKHSTLIRSLLAVGVVTSAAFAGAQATNPFPVFLQFEDPTYSTTFNGNGVFYTGTLGQDGWTAGGAYFVRTNQFFAGVQSAQFDGAVAVAAAGTTAAATFSAARPFQYAFRTGTPAATIFPGGVVGGTLLVQAKTRYVDKPLGRIAWAIETWGDNAGTTTLTSNPNTRGCGLGFNDAGEIFLKPRTALPAVKASQTLANQTWGDVALIHEIDTGAIFGILNGQYLTDASSNRLTTTLPLTDYNFIGELDFSSYIAGSTATASRTLLGVPTSAPRGDDDWWVDNVLVRHFAPLSVLGKVNLLDMTYAGRPATNISCAVTFTPTGGGSPTTVTVSLSAWKDITAVAPGAGTYDIKVKPSGWLSKTLSNVDVQNVGVYNLEFTCQNGDVDNSGEVDAADIDAVIANFGATGAAVQEDCDGSGEVDAADIDLVIANFGGTDQ